MNYRRYKLKDIESKKKKISKKNNVNNSSKEESYQNNKKFFIDKYNKFFGKNYLLKLLELEKKINNKKFIRVNLSKTRVDDIINILEKNKFEVSKTNIKNCIEIKNSPFSISSMPEFLSGKIYIQNFPSQIPANVVDWKELKLISTKENRKIRVLDMCSSPGSKTTQICDFLNFYDIPFKLIALEPNRKRFTKLINNIQRQKFKNVEIYETRGEDFKDSEKFDIIFLDAPCSGNIIGDRNWLYKRRQEGICENSLLQKKLLKNASKLVRDQGGIIYSTCSMEIEENEENIDYAINNLGLNTEIINLDFNFDTTPVEKFSNGVEKSIRIDPIKSLTEAFFVSKLKKIK